VLTDEEIKAAADKAAADAAALDAAKSTDDDANKVTDWEAEATKWKQYSRKHEDEAKSLRPAAARLAEIEEQNKTELQKAADRAAAAETKLAETEARVTRAEVASEKGIPANLLSGTTREELEASADALIAFRGEQKKLPDMGGGDRGTDVGADKKPQLTKEDVSKLTAEKKFVEIEQARTEGRLDDLLSGKTT
jgi:hypothetical protein